MFFRALFHYLREHIKTVIVFCMVYLIFFVVNYLYFVPLEPVFYAGLLSLVLCLLFGSYDFWKYYQHHLQLQQLLLEIRIGIEHLPEPIGWIEQDYQNLIEELFEEKVQIQSDADNQQTEMVDYYTLWAHQIKTPISAMKLLLQAENNWHLCADMQQELFKVEQYVEMVLQFLRLNGISSDLLIKQYPLDKLVKQAIKKYSILFIHQKISLQLDPIEEMVLTDEKWLVFVLEQILSNALKYTKSGYIHIYLEREKTLVIEDTGIGIRKEDIPRIFERGFTGYNGRMDKKATGIGLYLCKQILSKLNHSFQITSKIGEGTRVCIDLSYEALEMIE